jgi:hypothetical protein
LGRARIREPDPVCLSPSEAAARSRVGHGQAAAAAILGVRATARHPPAPIRAATRIPCALAACSLLPFFPKANQPPERRMAWRPSRLSSWPLVADLPDEDAARGSHYPRVMCDDELHLRSPRPPPEDHRMSITDRADRAERGYWSSPFCRTRASLDRATTTRSFTRSIWAQLACSLESRTPEARL